MRSPSSCRDLPASWQQAALPNDPIGTNWVYYEALIVSPAPVYTLTRDNLNPESRAPTCDRPASCSCGIGCCWCQRQPALEQ